MADRIFLNARYAFRSDTLENWQRLNPILEKGEPAIISDGNDGEWLKIGDGINAFNNLGWRKGPKGEQGIRGIQGVKGDKGDNYVLTLEDKQEIANMVDVETVTVDQTYSPTSENAQSGKAVAEAVDANKQYANNTFSAAIKNTVSGLVVSANDVSPIEHNLGVKVSSKNLFDIDKVLNTDNWYYYGGSISYPLNLTKGVRYTFSIENLQTFTDNFAIVRKANVSLWEHTVLFAINEKVGKLTYSFVADGTECLWMYANGIGNAAAFQIRINNILLNYTKSLQLELGDTATEYEPYVEPSTVPIKRYGKNLFDINSSWKWELGDSYSHMDIFVGANQTVTVSWDNDLTLGQGLYINIANELKHKGTSTSPYWLYHSTVSDLCKRSVTVTADADGYIYINLSGGTDKVAKLQVEYGTTATEYEPYIEPQTAVANADGIVTGLTSISPNMTVIADNNGVNLNVTYNVDTKTYIDNKFAELAQAILNT